MKSRSPCPVTQGDILMDKQKPKQALKPTGKNVGILLQAHKIGISGDPVVSFRASEVTEYSKVRLRQWKNGIAPLLST